MTSTTPWLPTLPHGWDVVQLRRIATIRNGADYKEVEVREGGYPVYGSGGEFRRASDYLFDGVSVLFGRKGTIDKPLLVSGRFWTVDTMFYTELRPNVEPRFLHYYALTMPFGYYSTNTALPSMTQGELGGHRMPLPPLRVQQAIADYLDRETAKIDALIAKQHELIDTALERRRAVVAAVVSSGVAGAETANFSRGWPTDLPSGWRRTNVREVVWERVEFNAGAADQRYLSLMANVGVIPYEEKGAVGNRKPDDLTKCKKVYAGDLVINSMNYQIGSYGLSELEGVCSPVYVVLVPREGIVDTAYVAGLFAAQPFQKLAQSYGNGILEHRRAISWSTLKNLPINLPPISEQRRIASFINRAASSIDELIQKTQRHIELATERRAALVTAAVTGELDIRGESA